jgi:phosphodiesterase/alkaline phosphatase D-like protein
VPTPHPPLSARLLSGPVLRHVDSTTAAVWVHTDRPAEVEILGSRARTFTVCGYHYALVDVSGLAPGSVTEYQVRVNGELAWPQPGSPWPASRIRTRGGGGPVRLVFGSCRHARPDDRKLAGKLGVDMLESYAARLTTVPAEEWPDALLLLGDQVYADEPTPQLRRWLSSRRAARGGSEDSGVPADEVNDFIEYTRLYREAWSRPEVRWLLSTVPTAMIFDDHDVRDDWNTSAAWRAWTAAQPWWAERIRGALASYWIYQHIGNLPPEERAADPVWCAVRQAGGDAWPILREMAGSADAAPETVRWSFRWDIDGVRLVMVDTRCGRMLAEGSRSMLDEEGFRWVEEAVRKDVSAASHLLVGSSLPWLLAPAVHDIQAANEAACARGGVLAERIRQWADLEHWAAFGDSFARLAALLRRVAAAPEGPAMIGVLSGDVHHTYVARADFDTPVRCPVYQLVCSPLHHRMPWPVRMLLRAAWFTPLATVVRRIVRRRGVPDPPLSWRRVTGPVFGNALSTLTLTGRAAHLAIERPHPLNPASRMEVTARTQLAAGGDRDPAPHGGRDDPR